MAEFLGATLVEETRGYRRLLDAHARVPLLQSVGRGSYDPAAQTASAKPPQRPDCVADDAVSCELVSAPNSLLTGKLTGNFADSGSLQRFWRPVSELIQ